ncbi:MAG TPA: SelB C-terminal domain-containing protein, partial [Dehalococcoidia bacterium]|nr:SelB C-terminal domain-containing protein [Dehalococcoidia bacterium]
GGIDLALLVVAADEGVMPQTREHLAILDLLGVRHGFVAITKSDLVDPEFIDLVREDVRETLAGTTLEGAEIVVCSAVTREGLADVAETMDRLLDDTPRRPDVGRPRLPIDRVFTVQGFGTVVTGTLLDGVFESGAEVEIVPGGQRARVRGLQSHRTKVQRALPGMRTAVNLTGVDKDDLRRGQVVTSPGWLRPTTAMDVRLRAVRYLRKPLRHNLHVTFHSGSAETNAVIRLLDRDAIPPGEETWAQIRTEEPVAVVSGDRFVVRTANDTVGGGVIVAPHAKRHRRRDQTVIATLEAALAGSPEDRALAALQAEEPADAAAVARRAALGDAEAAQALEQLAHSGMAVPLGPVWMSRDGFERLTRAALDAVEEYHRQFPLRTGMPREALRSRVRLKEPVFDAAVDRWMASKAVRAAGEALALPGHEPRLSPAQRRAADDFLAALRERPYSPPSDRRPEPEVLAFLAERGEIVDVGDGVMFAAEAYRDMVERIVARIREQGSLTLAEARDMFQTSRKYAQALLEHLDRERVTRRVGDERVLR